MTGFDKFAWISAICDDEQLGDGLKYVLQNIALWYTVHDAAGLDGLLYARQSTIADRLKVSTRQVKKAYAEARRLGYFVLVAERRRGRSHYSPDTYALVIPQGEIGEQCSPINEEIGEHIDRNRGTDRQKTVNRSTEKGERVDSLTCTNLTIKDINRDIHKDREGDARAAPAAAAPPAPETHDGHPPRLAGARGGGFAAAGQDPRGGAAPGATRPEGHSSPPVCGRHPDGNADEPCHQCRRVREWTAAQEREAQARQREAARAQGIRECPQCDDSGFLVLDGKTGRLAAFVPPPSADDVPEYVLNWLAELPDDSGRIRLYAKCEHGTGLADDNRRIAYQTFSDLAKFGYYAADE